MPEQDFENVLNDAVADTMSQLGETVRRTLSFYLEHTFNIKAEDIPHKTEEFDSAVNALLGPGAAPLESAILRRLSAKIDVNVTMIIKSSEERFPTSVNRAEELYRSSQSS
jgi:hypothetical protein